MSMDTDRRTELLAEMAELVEERACMQHGIRVREKELLECNAEMAWVASKIAGVEISLAMVNDYILTS